MSGHLVVNDSYEILTPSGWQNFLGVKRDIKQTLVVRFTDNTIFSCTPNHKIILNNKEVEVCTIKPGCIIYGNRVVDIKLSDVEYVYDPIEVASGNLYLSNDIVNHNCKFLGSSLTLINSDTIEYMSTCPTVYSKDGLDLYEYPVKAQLDEDTEELIGKSHSYVIVADTAKGVGGDYSAFVIMDVSSVPYKLVGKFRDNKIAPMLYPSVIYKVARDYNMAYVLIEVNSSEQVAHIMHNELEYENLIFVNRDTKTGQTVTGGFGGGKTQLGVQTDKRVKRIGCFTFKSLVEEKKLLITDADTISEISTFIQVKDSYAADDGYHDDLVMPLVLFSWLTTNPYFKELNDVNIREAMYQARIKQIEEDVVPFGFAFNGTEEEYSVEDGDMWKPEIPVGYLTSNL